MRRIVLLASLLAAPLAFAAANAAPPVQRTMTCPIGGASFTYAVPTSTAGLVARPDGKPYGVPAPSALPECPDNGLVMYKDYDPDEIAKLKTLIASDDYQALRKDPGQYYRAYWLMKQLGEGPENYLWALLQASWEADANPDLRTRYLTELAAESAKVPTAPSDINWIGMEGRSINALRELGRFDEAAARLAKVPVAKLDVPLPGGAAADPEAVAQARARHGWFVFFGGLKAAIGRHDKSLEPFDIIPRSVALGYCIDKPADSLDVDQRAFCEKEQASIDALRADRERAAADLKAVSRSREQTGR